MERNGIPPESVPKLIGGKHPGCSMINEIRDHIDSAAAPADKPREEPGLDAARVDKTSTTKAEQPGARESPAINARFDKAHTTKTPSLRRSGKKKFSFRCCAGTQGVVANGSDASLRVSALPAQDEAKPSFPSMLGPTQALPKLCSFEEEKQGDDAANQARRAKQGGKIHPLEPASARSRRNAREHTGNTLLVVPRTAARSQRTRQIAIAASFIVFVIWFVCV